MTKGITVDGRIVFQCRCQRTEEGTPDDTLMSEKMLETAESNQIHQVFADNAPFDNAAHIVLQDCFVCGLNFMTMIRVGTDQQTMFACRCGYTGTRHEYMEKYREHTA
jgi:hypothetical protein